MAQLVAKVMLIFCLWNVAGERALAEAADFCCNDQATISESTAVASTNAQSVAADSSGKSENCDPTDCDNEDCQYHQCHFGHCSVLPNEEQVQDIFKQVTAPFLMVDWGAEPRSDSSVIRPPIA